MSKRDDAMTAIRSQVILRQTLLSVPEMASNPGDSRPGVEIDRIRVESELQAFEYALEIVSQHG